MIATELYDGQGLGNQLFCYVTTRVIATDHGYDFSIIHPERFKGVALFDLDFGKKPEDIIHQYTERQLFHPENGSDITIHDSQLVSVADHTKLDGLMQDEQYLIHRRNDIRNWLKIKPEFDRYDYADDNTCIINFRGGEYARHPEFLLRKEYWRDAIAHMRTINKQFRFIVITDDPYTAKKFFPDFDVFHFSIAEDYSIIKNAYYLILSNSSFAWFPAWLSTSLKFCIAPKYWARHNISDGYWSMGYNITSGWHYLDRDGTLSDYQTCFQELNEYMKKHPDLYTNEYRQATRHEKGLYGYLKKVTPVRIKNVAKSLINETKHYITAARKPFDHQAEKKRKKQWLSAVEAANYRKTIKIYDVFNFFNELEVLDIRLHILNDYVDYFVLVESQLTHSGVPKELIYEKNKDRFKAFEHKIIHYVIEEPLKDFEDARNRLLDPNTAPLEKTILKEALASDNIPPDDNHYLRDFYEKESVKKPLVGLHDNDFCYISDLDEIWNPEAPIDYSKDDVYKYKQDAYVYYLNNRSNEDWLGWTGTIATKYKNIKDSCVNDLRTARKMQYTVIRNGGWHFTFQGGAHRIKDKLASYSYHELNTEDTRAQVEKVLEENKDIKGRYIRFWKDESKLPQYLLANRDRYKELFK